MLIMLYIRFSIGCTQLLISVGDLCLIYSCAEIPCVHSNHYIVTRYTFFSFIFIIVLVVKLCIIVSSLVTELTFRCNGIRFLLFTNCIPNCLTIFSYF